MEAWGKDDLEHGELNYEAGDFILAEPLQNVRRVQKDQSLIYEKFCTDDVRTMDNFCWKIRMPETRRHSFCSSLKFAPLYRVVAKGAELV